MCTQTYRGTLIRWDCSAGHALLRGPVWLSPPSTKRAYRISRETVWKGEQRRSWGLVRTHHTPTHTPPIPRHYCPQGDQKRNSAVPSSLSPFLFQPPPTPTHRPPDNTMQLVAPHSCLLHSLSYLYISLYMALKLHRHLPDCVCVCCGVLEIRGTTGTPKIPNSMALPSTSISHLSLRHPSFPCCFDETAVTSPVAKATL